MTDCMNAVFYMSEEDKKFKNILTYHQLHKTQTINGRSLKLCKPDFKTLQTLPRNSLEFHYDRTGKQNPGIKFLLESSMGNLLRTDAHVFSDSVLRVGNSNAIANQALDDKAP